MERLSLSLLKCGSGSMYSSYMYSAVSFCRIASFWPPNYGPPDYIHDIFRLSNHCTMIFIFLVLFFWAHIDVVVKFVPRGCSFFKKTLFGKEAGSNCPGSKVLGLNLVRWRFGGWVGFGHGDWVSASEQ